MSSELQTILQAIALYAAIVISPGPSFSLITRLSASGSRKAAFGATFGFALAASLYATLSMTGLSAIITQVGWLMTAIQIAGGCYLIYLGISAWRSSSKTNSSECSTATPLSMAKGFRMGLFIELANAKGIVFFVSFFVIAVPVETALWAKATILASSFMIEVLWYGAAAFLLSTRPARAVYDRFSVWIERVIGTILAGFGLRLISEKM